MSLENLPPPESTPFEIKQQKAKETFSTKGRKIDSGKVKGRVNVGGSKDERLAIAAEKTLQGAKGFRGAVKKIARSVRYVTFTEGDQSVDLNIKSLAKRLHLSTREIRKAANAGTLGTLVQREKQERLSKALDYYETLFKARQTLAKEGLSTKVLMAATKLGLRILQEPKHEGIQNLQKSFKIKNKKFSVEIANRTAELKITAYGKRLGSGTYGHVRNVIDLQMPGISKAVKTGSDEISSLYQLVNEANILNSFKTDDPEGRPFIRNGNGDAIGIVKAENFEKIQEGDIIVEQLQLKKYDGKLDRAFKASVDDKLGIAYQLLIGAANMERMGIHHLDIKPENVLVLKNQEGMWEAVISDFGGASKYPDKYSTPHTPRFTPSELRNGYTPVEAQQRDRFALGRTLYELFTKDIHGPFPKDKDDYIDTEKIDENKIRHKLEKAGVPDEVITLILDLIDITSTNNFETALTQFEAATKERSGTTFNQMRAARAAQTNRSERVAQRPPSVYADYDDFKNKLHSSPPEQPESGLREAKGPIKGGTFEGTVDNTGRPQGRGHFVNKKEGFDYEGEFKDGKPHGSGMVKLADGSRIQGTWENGLFIEGTGLLYGENGTYFGSIGPNFLPHGSGALTDNEKRIFKGTWDNGNFIPDQPPASTQAPAEIPSEAEELPDFTEREPENVVRPQATKAPSSEFSISMQDEVPLKTSAKSAFKRVDSSPAIESPLLGMHTFIQIAPPPIQEDEGDVQMALNPEEMQPIFSETDFKVATTGSTAPQTTSFTLEGTREGKKQFQIVYDGRNEARPKFEVKLMRMRGGLHTVPLNAIAFTSYNTLTAFEPQQLKDLHDELVKLSNATFSEGPEAIQDSLAKAIHKLNSYLLSL